MGERGMSKQRARQPDITTSQTPLAKPVIFPSVVEVSPVIAITPAGRIVEEYRHCPVCWHGSGGYGVAYSTQGQTRYYKCCKTTKSDTGPCGHTWTATVTLETIKIEHRIVTLDGER